MRWDTPRDESVSAIVDVVDRFCKEEAEPVRFHSEVNSLFPKKLVEHMGERGFFGLTIPEEYGGSGMGTVAASYVARRLAYTWPSLHLIWTANSSLAAFPIMYAGSPEQKQRLLPKFASGEALGCFALTETEAGSDAQSLRTQAKRTLDGWWALQGSKVFITNAAHANVAIVFARTSAKKISAFILESTRLGLDYPGVTVKQIPKCLQKSAEFCEIRFDDVILPSDALLGSEGQGFEIAMQTLDGGRINIAAQAIGMAMRMFDDALAYARLRKQFGKTVFENQAVQFDFADAHARLNAAWQLVVDVSMMRDRQESVTSIASQAKLVATETSLKVAVDLAKYFGGMGATLECEAYARVLDVLITCVYEGANNIQKMVIAKHL